MEELGQQVAAHIAVVPVSGHIVVGHIAAAPPSAVGQTAAEPAPRPLEDHLDGPTRAEHGRQ